ncbi:phosphodiesterase [Minwuia sp.]|uniref:phosphodiesterase n=1 Tax=Minwuia sp. TaxID=2493630 RepID=UPI003A8FA83B
MTIIVQISDMHVADPDTPSDDLLHQADRLATAVDWINRLQPQPDAVLATGDLVDHFQPSQYQRLRSILTRLDMPFYLMMGNHDHRQNLREAFPDHAYLGTDDFVQYTVENLGVRIIALDTQVTGKTEGALCTSRLDWLDARLSEQFDRPTIVALHHPPFASGVVQMDAHGLMTGREELAGILDRHPQIERVVIGHIHRPMTTLFGGRLAMTCPSTSHQIALQVGRADGVGIVDEPPACLIHVWRPPHGLVSHLVPVGAFPALADVDLRRGH